MEKKFFLWAITLVTSCITYAQSINQDKTVLANYLIRVCENEQIDGVRPVEYNGVTYLVSVVSVKKSPTASATNRVAQVKSMRQVSQYLNDNTILDSETLVVTSEDVTTHQTITEVVDRVRESSSGFAKSMESLTSFDISDTEQCYIYYRLIDELM